MTEDYTNPSGAQIPGYRKQSQVHLELVKHYKGLEEYVLRSLDSLGLRDDIDKRWLAIGRTSIEQGFMAVNRAVMQPQRIALPEDRP